MNSILRLIQDYIIWLLLFASAAVVALIVYLNLYLQETTQRDTIDSTVLSAKATIGQFKVLRKYYTENVVKKARESGMSMAVDHASKPNTIPLPATLIHDLSHLMVEGKQRVQLNLYSEYPFPNRRDRVLTPIEQEALTYLKQNPEETFTKTGLQDGKAVLHVMATDKMVAEACVSCHNSLPTSPKKDWKLNEVRGVLEVITPIHEALDANAQVRNRVLILTSIMAGGVGQIILGLLLLLRTQRRRISALKRVVEATAEGDFSQSVPIDGNDDLGSMAAALDRMVESLKHKSEQMVKVVRHAAQGDLTQQVTVKGSDPMGQMGEGLSLLMRDWSRSIQKIQAGAEHLSTEASQINTVTTRMTQTAESAAREVGSVSRSATEVNERLLEAAEAAEAVTASVREIARGATEAARVASDAVKRAGDADAWMKKLEGQSRDIGDVLKLIASLSGQTHLLALNASIEAAIAGQAGKGFGVVAQEVKALAGGTAEATGKIEQSVKLIREDTAGASEALAAISTIIRRIHEIQQSISVSVEEQARAVERISSCVKLAAQESQAEVSQLGGVAHASSATASGASQLAKAAQALDALSSELKALVQQFKYL